MKVSEKFLLQVIEEETKSALSQSMLIKEGVPKIFRTKLYNKIAEFFNWGDARKPVKSTDELTDAAKRKLAQQQQEASERATQAAARKADEAAKRELLYQDELVKDAIEKANRSLERGVVKITDQDVTELPVVFREAPTAPAGRRVRPTSRQGKVTVDPTKEGIDSFRAWAAKEGVTLDPFEQDAIEKILTALHRARTKGGVAAQGGLPLNAAKAGSKYSPGLKKALIKFTGAAVVGLAAGGVILWQIVGDNLSMWSVPEEVVEEIDRAEDAMRALDDITIEDVEEKPEDKDKAKRKPASPGTWSGL